MVRVANVAMHTQVCGVGGMGTEGEGEWVGKEDGCMKCRHAYTGE